ncbi:hypothetical protein KXV98_007258 [Aspergillus fumigatus]|nr:hypothetical protein KXV98_007258 [Aspergillus fumigatus]KAJ8233223.1 hypothetical protein LV156_005183 [Aspergillus fumigatus]KAJ8236582.1 hypothetical protein LV160_005157 [Aspergillus fumigatus]
MPLMDRFLVPLPDYWNNWAKKPDAGYTQEPTDISTAVLKDLWRSLLEEQNDEAEAYQSLPQRFGCEKSNRTLRANGCRPGGQSHRTRVHQAVAPAGRLPYVAPNSTTFNNRVPMSTDFIHTTSDPSLATHRPIQPPPAEGRCKLVQIRPPRTQRRILGPPSDHASDRMQFAVGIGWQYGSPKPPIYRAFSAHLQGTLANEGSVAFSLGQLFEGVLCQLANTSPGTIAGSKLRRKERIIMFMSFRLNDAETRYTNLERDASLPSGP